MKKSDWKYYLFWIVFTETIGLLASILTRNSTQIYNEMIIKPFLSPPAIIFPIVWTILYALMGISIARIRLLPPSKKRTRATILYLLQLGVNFFWSILFFNLQAFGFAFYWLVLLWILIYIMIIDFRNIDTLASYLFIPYFLWVSFAGYLNFMIWFLN